MNPYFLSSMMLTTVINTNMNLDVLFGGIIDIICTISRYVGIVMASGGVFSLILAYKDDNAEGQSRAIRIIVVAAILISLLPFLQMAGIVA